MRSISYLKIGVMSVHCRNCNNQLADNAIACTQCGQAPLQGKNFCQNCGAQTQPAAVACISCGAGLSGGPQQINIDLSNVSQKKLVCGICAIVFGYLGVHKFILGHTKPAIIMLCVSLLTFGIGASVMWVIGIIEGITYLTKSDAEFQQIYLVGHKEWF